MPREKELRAEGYLIDNLYKPYQYDIVKQSICMYGSPFIKATRVYVDKIGNFRTPTKVLLSNYAYGLNNIQQFANTEEIVIFQALFKTKSTTYGTARWYTDENTKIPIRSLVKLIDSVYNNVRPLAIEVANRVERHNAGIELIPKTVQTRKTPKPKKQSFYDISDCWDLE
jgi:uncharacterized protein (DUF433 family)